MWRVPSEVSAVRLWWMTDVTKLSDTTVRAVSISRLHIFSTDKRELKYKLRIKANQCHHYLQIKKNENALHTEERWWLKTDQRRLQSKRKHQHTVYWKSLSHFCCLCCCLCCLSLSLPCLPLSLSLSLVTEWIISCRGPWNQTPNPELPFLLASKIFIRTIRSSDKASTEGWGARGRKGRMCQQDVCSATLYTPTTGPSSSIWDAATSLFAPSQARQSGEGGMVPANPMPPPPPLLPSQQALLCPSPWAVGVGHTARTLGGGGHKGKLIVAWANSEKPLCTKARSHFSQQGHWKAEGGVLACGPDGL